MRKIVRLLAVAAGVVAGMTVVAACARPVFVDVGAVPTGSPEIMPAWTSCSTDADVQTFGGAEATELPRLGVDFVPTAAVVCNVSPQDQPGGGSDLVATEGRTDEVTALVAALRLPDVPRTAGDCTLELPLVPWFAVLDATGRWVRPGTPVDACGKIRIEVRKALSDLKLSTVSSRTIRTLESVEAAKAGCSQGWADMVSAEASSTRSGSYAVEIDATGGVRLCVYRVAVEEQGTSKPAGDFEYGRVLAPHQWSAIEQGLRTADPVRDCTQHAGRFALLRSVSGAGGEVYVELDGCQRVMTTPYIRPPGFAQAGAELLSWLAR